MFCLVLHSLCAQISNHSSILQMYYVQIWCYAFNVFLLFTEPSSVSPFDPFINFYWVSIDVYCWFGFFSFRTYFWEREKKAHQTNWIQSLMRILTKSVYLVFSILSVTFRILCLYFIGFAFHADAATFYKIIMDDFSERSICELSEIQLFPEQHMMAIVQKGSPLRKMITYG